MAIEWKAEYSVGFDRIDEQHQELFQRFNALMEACNNRKGREKVGEVLGYLDDYVTVHFREEEMLMDSYGYPQAAEHKEIHRAFCSKLAELKGIYNEEGASLHLLVVTNKTILQWLLQHIQKADTQLGAFLKEKT